MDRSQFLKTRQRRGWTVVVDVVVVGGGVDVEDVEQ